MTNLFLPVSTRKSTQNMTMVDFASSLDQLSTSNHSEWPRMRRIAFF